MTTYSPTARSTHQALAANVMDTVNIPLGYKFIELKSRLANTTPIYFRYDGVNAAAAGDGTLILEPGEAIVFANPKQGGKAAALTLISTAIANYSVTGISA